MCNPVDAKAKHEAERLDYTTLSKDEYAAMRGSAKLDGAGEIEVSRRSIMVVDTITQLMCIAAVCQVAYGVYCAGLERSAELILDNPFMGGENKIGDLPVWTYIVGHSIPGLIAKGLGVILVNAVWKEWRYAPTHFLKGIVWSIYGVAGSSIFLAHLHKGTTEGTIGYIYKDINEYPLWYLPAGLLVEIFIGETWFYWVHRAMHHRFLYKYVHGVHHSFNPSSTACATAFHPLDLGILAAGTSISVSIVPIHFMVHQAYLLVNLISTIYQHSALRWELPGDFFNTPNLHCIHHDYGQKPINNGSMFCLWDRAMGTYRTKVPAWVPATHHGYLPQNRLAPKKEGAKKNL